MELTRYNPRNVRNPFGDAWNLRKDLNRLFDSFLDQPAEQFITRNWTPAVDVVEEKDHFLVKAELPGMKQDDIKVSIHNNTLTLKGERKYEHKDKNKGFYHLERGYGEFVRAFQLPTDVETEQVKAKYRDGVLEIEIPKSEKAKEREINIKVE